MIGYATSPQAPATRGCEFNMTVEYEDRDGEFHELEVMVVGSWQGHHYAADNENPVARMEFVPSLVRYDAEQHPDFDARAQWFLLACLDEADKYYPEEMRLDHIR